MKNVSQEKLITAQIYSRGIFITTPANSGTDFTLFSVFGFVVTNRDFSRTLSRSDEL